MTAQTSNSPKLCPPGLRRVVMSCGLLGILVACTPPQPGLTISPDALARADTLSMDVIAPDVSNSATLAAFDEFCARYPAAPARTRQAARDAGYFLLGTSTKDDLEMWASDTGRPLVATGSNNGADVCMVMVQQDAGLVAAVGNFVDQKHSGRAVKMGAMQFGADRIEDLWLVPQNPPLIYFTMVQQQPDLGLIQAVAVVTE